MADQAPGIGSPHAEVRAGEVAWKVTTRPYHYGYENGYERFGEALAEIRRELGYETTEAFSGWLYEEGVRRYGLGTNLDVPLVLLDAFEFPALDWGSSMHVIEFVAQALGVSPGTMIDELWLRASGFTEAGVQIDDE